MENPNCAYFRNNFFCRKSEKYYVNCPREKNTWQEFVFLRLRKRTEKKNQKEPKNSDEYIAKNVRNVGKIRLYEKVSVKWWNFINRSTTRQIHRRGSELCHEKSVPCGHSVCHVLSGRIRQKCMFAPQWGVFYGHFIHLCWFSPLF